MRCRYCSVLLVAALAALTAHAQQMAGMNMAATPPVANTSSSSSCIHNPTTRNCTDYEYPESSIRADMSELCEMMPYMVGCSIQRQCEVRPVAQRCCTEAHQAHSGTKERWNRASILSSSKLALWRWQ